MQTVPEVLKALSKDARERRLQLNLTQQGLADRSFVSLGSIKRFETSGRISLESLLKVAVVLDSLENFNKLFAQKMDTSSMTLDQIMKQVSKRQRGRIK
jgi:transcriptional regulator with XRE-family HTH domain